MFIAAVLLFMVGYDSGLYYQQLYKDGCSECPDPTLITATIILLIMVCPTIVILLLTNTRFLPDVLQVIPLTIKYLQFNLIFQLKMLLFKFPAGPGH